MERTAPLAAIAAALRRERERMGLSLTELARRAGIAKSTLSQLESGTGNPSVETLWAIAVVLDVPFSRLVDPAGSPVRVIRAGEGLALPSEHAPFTGTLLAACPPGARRDLHVITAEPGAAREAHAHIRGTTEHLLVTAGRWRAGPAGEEVELGVGDYARFPGDRPHVYQALVAGSGAVLVMEYV
ncbi:helix-turn-helix domain-containing protein [Pseudonocardia oceani]|uniref:Helix-turn-helix transcriptional regulator n=3 Tax=Pseudonocardia oceani TaxID=2792013 RepID=A0ABS6UJA7_9PSEU|nr:XRE family transcriptional regulator [Pseudonocardia oceani]MBW0125232.1 helix-turn-helix transcriptional regulator [Pseudonocardia oceani]MBW0132330.1 helix-turn-helix transcriptional regulator [Pseudonocardia oceani]